MARCLTRLSAWVERVVVIDSFSRDRTVEIAQALGAEVLQHPFKNHSDQFRWGLAAAAPTTPWVMRIDCDEYFEETAPAALAALLPGLPDEVSGVTVKRKFIFRDRWIRHGRYYPTYLLRIWRNGAGEVEQRWMDEHIILNRGSARLLEGADLVDHNLNDLDLLDRQAQSLRNVGDGRLSQPRRFALRRGCAYRWLRRRRAPQPFLKNSVYGRAPLYLRAVALFVYRYVFRLGFLDGKVGFVFHFLHGFWLFMLIDAKLDEARNAISAARPRSVQTAPCRNAADRAVIETARRPVVLILLGCFWPGNDSSGPNQSFISLARALGDTFEFRVVARDGATGAPPGARADVDRWIDLGFAKARYRRVGRFGAIGLGRLIAQTPHDVLWLNSMFDREFSLPALVLRRLGLIARKPTLLSPRGEFGLRRAQSQVQPQVVLSRGRAQARPLARRHLACDQRGGGRRHRAWTGGKTPDRHSPQHPPRCRDAHLRTERERRAAGRVRRPHRAGKAVGFRAELAWKSGIARRFRHLRSGRR